MTLHIGGNVSSSGGGGGPPPGDVFGPGLSTDNAVVRFDGITGKLTQNSRATLSDQSELDLLSAINFSPRFSLNALGFVHGNTFIDQNRSVEYATDSNFGGASVKSISTGDVSPYLHESCFGNDSPLPTVACHQIDTYKSDGLGSFGSLGDADLAFAVGNNYQNTSVQLLRLNGAGDLFTHRFLNGRRPFRSTAIATTLTSTDEVLQCTAASFGVTLPSANSVSGRTFTVKNSGIGQTITMLTTGGDLIDGIGSGLITLLYNDSITVVSDGADWVII